MLQALDLVATSPACGSTDAGPMQNHCASIAVIWPVVPGVVGEDLIPL